MDNLNKKQQHRMDAISYLSNLKKLEMKENKRLNRKKEELEVQTVLNSFTLIGSIKEIEFELKRIKKEKLEKNQKINQINNQIFKTWTNYFNLNNSIKRLQQMIYMEDDIHFYYWYLDKTNILILKNQRKKALLLSEAKDPFLKAIKNLPNDLISYIKSFITFETKCNLLENKYNPLKMVSKFKLKPIKKIINKIFQPTFLALVKEETKDILISKFKTFYHFSYEEEYRFERLKRNITDEKIFLKNCILTLQPKEMKKLFHLFKEIIIIYKIMFGKLK